MNFVCIGKEETSSVFPSISVFPTRIKNVLVFQEYRTAYVYDDTLCRTNGQQ